MARKRKGKRRISAAPLLLAFALLGIVAWALLPRAHRPRAQHVASSEPPVAQASPQATQAATPAVSPSIVPSVSPSAAPTASPAQNQNGPRIAIIIDDCGQWIPTERAYLQLPIPLTLAVLPHVHYTSAIAQEAADAGKGVMLHLPMEPLSHINPGPGEITTGMSDADVAKQTEDDIAQVPLARGFNNHEGSEASADDRVMKDVMAVAKAHDLFFVDSRTNAKTVGAQDAQEAGVPTASRNVFLDNKADVAYTESMLERTVAIAQRSGSAIAIGHPKPSTLEALRTMYPKMEAEGVQFVLASDLVH